MEEKYILSLIEEGESQVILSVETNILHGSNISQLSPRWILEHGLLHLESYLNQTRDVTFYHVIWRDNSLQDCLSNEGVIGHQPLREGEIDSFTTANISHESRHIFSQ